LRIGLITDVHNHPVELARALALFRSEGVDQVVTIGDTCDAFGRADGGPEVASLLIEANAIGVWGNHDFTLCGEVSAGVRERFPEVVLSFMVRMQPRLVIDDSHFSHKESSIDPNDVMQLWELSDQPLDLWERAKHAFAAVTQRLQFVGHYHRWWVATPGGVLEWNGSEPLSFDPNLRYFVVVGATCEGWCAILDTDANVLRSLWCGASVEA